MRPNRWLCKDIIIGGLWDLRKDYLKETFLNSNFGLFENAPNCVHTPIEVENTTPDSFIFEIEVKGPQGWSYPKASILRHPVEINGMR
jgi:hypothetical protein